jgi:hypothetical protein
MNTEVGPVYSIPDSFKSAAPECKTGIETLVKIDPIITASFSVHVPLWVPR